MKPWKITTFQRMADLFQYNALHQNFNAGFTHNTDNQTHMLELGIKYATIFQELSFIL